MKKAINRLKDFLVEHYSKIIGALIIGYLATFWKHYEWLLTYTFNINLTLFTVLNAVFIGAIVYSILKIKKLIKQEEIEDKQELAEENDINKKKQAIQQLRNKPLIQYNYYQLLEIAKELNISDSNPYGEISAESLKRLVEYLEQADQNSRIEEIMSFKYPAIFGLVAKAQQDFNYMLDEELEILGGK